MHASPHPQNLADNICIYINKDTCEYNTICRREKIQPTYQEEKVQNQATNMSDEKI